jgi:hypothetical protein
VLEHCGCWGGGSCSVGQSFMDSAGVRKVEGAGVEAHVSGDRCQLAVVRYAVSPADCRVPRK